MEIKRIGSLPSSQGSADYSTGTVHIDPLFEAPDPARVRGGSVTLFHILFSHPAVSLLSFDGWTSATMQPSDKSPIPIRVRASFA
jgi:hypothetical protein